MSRLIHLQIVAKMAESEQQLAVKNGKLKRLEEEVQRRQYMEEKVQQYVKSLCLQNERCKKFIREEMEEEKGNEFLQSLRIENVEEQSETESEV